jgi:hypothetical protein
MRTWIARAVAPIVLCLLCPAAASAQTPPPYLLVRSFSSTAVSPPNTVVFKGAIQNFCGSAFPAGTDFEITYNGQPFDIPIAGLGEGQTRKFDVTEQVTAAPQTPASLTFAIILNAKHNVSPCVVSLPILP